jgi:hypothetical protein
VIKEPQVHGHGATVGQAGESYADLRCGMAQRRCGQADAAFTPRYNVSLFEYPLGESGGSLQLDIANGQVKWPTGPNLPYPEELR